MRAITDDERRQVVAVIHDYIGEAVPASVRALVGWDLSNQPPGLNGFRTAGWILDLALRQPAPEMFIHVVQKCDEPGALDTVQALVAELLAQPQSWIAAPAMVLWMPTTKDPFIDRDVVRDNLAVMAAGHGAPAITIEGPIGSGKRTISRYVEDLAGRSKSFTAIPTELRAEPQQGLLTSLVTDLRYELGLPPAFSWTSPVPRARRRAGGERHRPRAADHPRTVRVVGGQRVRHRGASRTACCGSSTSCSATSRRRTPAWRTGCGSSSSPPTWRPCRSPTCPRLRRATCCRRSPPARCGTGSRRRSRARRRPTTTPPRRPSSSKSTGRTRPHLRRCD